MEKITTSVEGNYHQASDSDTVSESSGSQFVRIGAISIDLNLPMPVKEKGKCQHFSIRGYVAEMRKKDKQSCSPFGSCSNHNRPEEQLPPLDVPKFKWWQCDNCMFEVGADESAGDDIGDASAQTGSTTAVAYILSEMKYLSDSHKGDRSKVIMVDDSTDTSDDEFISSWKRNKAICNVVENKTVKSVNSLGDGTGSEGVRIEEIGNPATKVIVSKQCSTREIETNSPVADLLNINTNTEPISPNDGNDKVVPHDRFGDGRDSEIDLEKEKGSRNGQRTASNTSDQIEVLGSKEKVLNMSNVKLHGLPSLGSRKGTETSKGTDANWAENSQCNLHQDIAHDLPRRKTPKVRLMTDLLGGKVNLEKSCANAERFSANTMPMVLSESDTVAATKDKVSFLEDVGKGIKISQKKRNMSQEDGCESGMNLDGKMDKRFKALNQNQKAERSSMEIEVTDSRPGENGTNREQRLQSGSRSVKIKRRSDKDSGVSRKKHKQAQVVGGYSLQMPLEGKNSGIGTNGYGANILFQSSHASTSTGNVERHLRNNNESLHGKERESGLSWNSNKLLEVKHASSHMNVTLDKNLRRESFLKGKDVVQMPIGMGMVTSQPEKELSIKEKLDQSLSSFRGAQKHVENDTIQSKSTTDLPLILQKANKSCDPLRKENTLIRQSNVSKSGQSSRKGLNSLVKQPNVFESGQSSWKEVNSLVRQPNVSEPGQYSTKGLNSLLRQSNLSESGQCSRKGAKSLVRHSNVPEQPNVPETSQSSRKGVSPLVRQTNVSETGQSSRKGVNSLSRQSNVSESGQSSRNGVILDLNQKISQTPPLWQEVQSSQNLLQRGNIQIRKPMETHRSSSKANLNEIRGHSYVIKPQKDQRLKQVMEKGPSDDMPMEIVQMSAWNQYERSHALSQSNLTSGRNENGAVTWLNPGSTSFYPVHANINADVGALRGNILHLSNVKANSTEMMQVQEPQFNLFGTFTQSQQKPSKGEQVSAPVPTRWGLQPGEGSKSVWFPAAQNISFGHDNPQNYLNQENHKLILGRAPGSLQKGRTISDIKSVDLKSRNEWSRTSKKTGNAEHSTKGMGSLNPYSSETMPATQSLKLQERPFSPCNNHPLIHVNGKQSILINGSFVSHHPLNESSGVHIGGFTAGHSSRQPVPYFNGQVSLGSQRQEKKRKSHAPVRLGGRKLQQSVSSSGLLRTTRNLSPSKNDSRGIVGPSSSKVVPLQDDDASKSLDVVGCSTPITVLPVSSIPEKDPPCLFNQNPADIVLADDERYLITAEDQRIRDKSSLREKSGAVHLDGRKRLRRKERPGRMPVGCRAS